MAFANPNHLLHLSPEGRRRLRELEGAHDDIDSSFSESIRVVERAVQRQISHQHLTQEQFDALVSFTFNTGASGAMLVLRRVDAGDFDGAADAMERNIHAHVDGKVVRVSSLAERRREESAPLRS